MVPATVPPLPYLVLVGGPGERLHAAEVHDGEALVAQDVAWKEGIKARNAKKAGRLNAPSPTARAFIGTSSYYIFVMQNAPGVRL
uniref:Uncharacterized protein n=1 Tax=Pristionchus pacificus TaxID=54126 RepID=A0A2A6CCJ2_PRIPA|eukprot:PDM75849.1 hypothetical protein PRIPAC_40228 [Pristionchus pacificus]